MSKNDSRGTIFKVDQVANNSQDKNYNRTNVYNADIINNTGFEISISSQESGTIKIPAGKSIPFRGHPEWPGVLSFAVEFTTPGHADTDSLTIIYSEAYGKCSE